jgi:excisionase family DNA binding protein
MRGLLAAAPVPRGRLGLEVAEETLAGPGVRAILAGVARDGAPVFVDGFGAAGASLSVLRDVPLAGVKIHGALVAALGADPTADAVAEGAVLTARRLGIATVAEGVEDGECLRAVAALGFDAAQGFAIARPVPIAGLEGVLASAGGRAGSGPTHVGVRAAADSLGISESTVRRWVDSGRLQCVRTAGGHRRVRRADVERLARPEHAAVRLAAPFAAQPAVAALLDDGAGGLLAAAARALYRGRTRGWFGTPRGELLGVAWLERLAVGVRSGDAGGAWAATHDYLSLAQLGGAPVIERFLFLERIGVALVQLAIDRHLSRDDVAGIRRLVAWLQQRLLAAVGAP